ncbi:hypothetical protein [Leptotrichia wadei]|uniref:hypothetical protein n=1 Tax=Leptotrichia wadei TaxID=157687 RepID=UPI0028E58A23|nr:hypothetical protein [Leptotrichia wadei]
MEELKREVSAVTINRRIKKGNNELLGKVQVYVVNKKNNRTYLLFKNFEIIVKNSMFNHSILEMTFQVAIKDEFTVKKMENIKSASEGNNLLYQDKQYIGVDLNSGKTLFYGIIEKIDYNEKSRIYKLKASSISKLLDRIPQFVDFKTGYSLDFFLKKMQAKIHRYLSNDATNQREEIALSRIDFDIKDEELEFNSIMKYGYIIMYNETYWEFLKRILFTETVKIPIYMKGKRVTIGFAIDKNENKDKNKKTKLSGIKNEVYEYLEIGDYNNGFCLYESEIRISNLYGTEYYYKSETPEEIKKFTVNIKEIYPFVLEGKVIRTVDIEKMDYWQKEQIEYAKNENKKLDKKRKDLIDEKNKLEEHRTEVDKKLEELLEKERLTEAQKSEKKALEEELKNLDKRLGTSKITYHSSEIETWEGDYKEIVEEGEMIKEIDKIDTQIKKNDIVLGQEIEQSKRGTLLGTGRIFNHPSEIETWEGDFEEVIDGEIPKRIENVGIIIDKNEKIINKVIEETKNIGVEVDFNEALKKLGDAERNRYPYFEETVEGIENGVYSAEMMGEKGVKINTETENIASVGNQVGTSENSKTQNDEVQNMPLESTNSQATSEKVNDGNSEKTSDATGKETTENNVSSSEKQITVQNEYYYAYDILSNSGYSKGNSTTLIPQPGEKILIIFFSNRSFSFGTLSNENKENIKNEIIKFNTNQMQMQADKNINVNAKEKVSFESSLIDYKTEN